MKKNLSVSHHIIDFLFWLLLWGLCGSLFNQAVLGVLVGCLLSSFWHLYHLSQLQLWLQRNDNHFSPLKQGVWGEIFYDLQQWKSHHRRRRTQLTNLVSRFHKGAEAIPDAAVMLDTDASLIWANRAASDLLGVSWPQSAAKTIKQLIVSPEFASYWDAKNFDEPLTMVSAVNVSRVLEVRVISYGKSQVLLLARDITRLKQLEMMRSDFVANVSHELKTPLTVLQGYLEVMAMMDDSHSQQAGQIRVMEQQAHRMKNLLESLLTLSKIESADRINPSHKVNMSAILATVEQEARKLSNGRHTFTFEVEQNLNLYGDDVLLQIACANLVRNAVRYSPEGNIVIKWQHIGSNARFSVQDQGIGIAPEHLSRLTERFYRVDKDRSLQTGGTGLGLAIVKHALSHHNTRLEIRSKIGEGSCFYFEFKESMVCSDPIFAANNNEY